MFTLWRLKQHFALKLILEQDIEVEALNLVTPFCQCQKSGYGCAPHQTTIHFRLVLSRKNIT
jgi:Na+-translocating ferredoxin:NAD+ oxidoreductase RNF subunit RnfB